MSRVQAQLVEWNDGKGFGFARLPGGTKRVFVHIKSLDAGEPRPRIGDELDFVVGAGRNGRPAAEHVQVLRPDDLARRLPMHIVTAIMLFLLVQVVVILGKAPLWFPGLYVFMGGVAVYLYARDKRAARDGTWRVPETQLIAIDLLFGVIGGLLAQHRYAHKRSKISFQARSFVVVGLHALLLAGLGSGVIQWSLMDDIWQRMIMFLTRISI